MRRLFPLCVLVLAVVATPAASQDVAAGASLFKMRCQTCHGIAAGRKNPMGPNLAAVIGRKAGTGDFAYSEAMKKSGLSWTPALIEKYLAAPAKVVPGGKMVINVADPKQRADIVAFLQSQGK